MGKHLDPMFSEQLDFAKSFSLTSLHYRLSFPKISDVLCSFLSSKLWHLNLLPRHFLSFELISIGSQRCIDPPKEEAILQI